MRPRVDWKDDRSACNIVCSYAENIKNYRWTATAEKSTIQTHNWIKLFICRFWSLNNFKGPNFFDSNVWQCALLAELMNEHIFIPYFCNPAISKRMSHDLFSSIHTCVSVKAVKLGVTFLKSYFQDEKCSEIRRWTETGKSRNRVEEGSRDKCVLFLLLLQMNQLLLKFSCVCLCVCVCIMCGMCLFFLALVG